MKVKVKDMIRELSVCVSDCPLEPAWAVMDHIDREEAALCIILQ